MASRFQTVIRRLIEQNNWEPGEINEKEAQVDVVLDEEGGTYTVYITLDEDNLVEFVVESTARFAGEGNISHPLSTLLLRRNTELVIGYWTLVEDDEQLVYALMDLEDLDVLDQEGGVYFSGIISDMIGEVVDFDQLLSNGDWDSTALSE